MKQFLFLLVALLFATVLSAQGIKKYTFVYKKDSETPTKKGMEFSEKMFTRYVVRMHLSYDDAQGYHLAQTRVNALLKLFGEDMTYKEIYTSKEYKDLKNVKKDVRRNRKIVLYYYEKPEDRMDNNMFGGTPVGQ